jgi:hypothetical protein
MNLKIKLLAALIAIGATGLVMSDLHARQPPTATPEPTNAMAGMMGMEMDTDFSADDLAPLVGGLYDGEDVFFIHTEASDPDVASLLTDMMGPVVVTVPSLAEIPAELLGDVYVFTNGIAGMGPLGFQPDVFDTVPGDEDYTPLRAVVLVTWLEEATPRLLGSIETIQAAADAGEIALERSGIVVNMPILVWPGGQR